MEDTKHAAPSRPTRGQPPNHLLAFGRRCQATDEPKVESFIGLCRQRPASDEAEEEVFVSSAGRALPCRHRGARGGGIRR
jgi:hypothetical protein